MHLTNLAVTRRALDARSNVRLVSVESVRLRLNPVHAFPRRLLFSLSVGRELLDLGAFGLNRLVTTHASADVWNSRVRRLVCILVTKRTLKLRRLVPFFSDVLPVIELDRLQRSVRLAGGSQQHQPDHRYHQNHEH